MSPNSSRVHRLLKQNKTKPELNTHSNLSTTSLYCLDKMSTEVNNIDPVSGSHTVDHTWL